MRSIGVKSVPVCERLSSSTIQSRTRGSEVFVSGASSQAPTNQQIVRLLEAISPEVAETRKHQEPIARDVDRLLKLRNA